MNKGLKTGKLFLTSLLFFLFLLCLYGTASAGTWEYVTHGGYEAAVEAWKKVALIFSSSDYKGLLTVAAILGFFIASVSFILKAAFGIRATSYTWLSFLAVSAIVYGAFILPKDKIVIYDETLNRGPYEVDGVPVLVATLAGTLNEAERALIELVATSSDPIEDYRYNPAGISFNALGSVRAKQVPSYIYRSLYNYFKDCIITTAAIGSPFTFDDLASGRVLLRDAITQSANPSLYTVIYDSSGHDSTYSCSEAAPIVSNYISSYTNFQQVIRSGCARAGYDPDSAASYQMCKDMMSRSAAFLLEKAGITTTSDLLTPLQQLLFADISQDYILAHGPEAVAAYLATQKTTGSFIGLGIHANNWIPELKEALTATAISLTPLILLFFVTPFAGRAVGLLAGMFIWLGMWGVIDAVITSFGLSMAADSAKYLAAGSPGEGLGLFAASVLPDVNAKIYAIFGALRWSGLMLASVMTTMLVRFGGTALAMLAGQIAAQPMGSGAAAGSAVSSEPVQTVSNLVVPTQAWANAAAAEGVRNLMRGMSRMQFAELAGRSSAGSSFASSTLLQAEKSKLISSIGKYGNISSEEAFQIGMMSAYREIGETKGFLSLANEIKKSPVLRKMLGVSEGASDKEIFSALYRAGAYAFGAESAGKFAALVKEGKLSAAALQSVIEYRSRLEGLENYLKEEFASDFQKDPYHAGKILAQKLAEVKQAQLGLAAKKGELGANLIEKIEGFSWINPAAKALQRMVLMDKLDDGVISAQTQEFLRNFETWGRKFFGSDIDTIMGHFSNFDFVVQSEKEAEQLREMGVNADVGDVVHIDYANLVKGENGYDLAITRDHVKVFKPHDVDILGQHFSFAGGEIESVGDERHGSMILRGGHLLTGDGKFLVNTVRQEIVNGKYVLKEFSGAYEGNVKGLEKLLAGLGITGLVKRSAAWNALKQAIEEGKQIQFDYRDGKLTLSSGGRVLFERTGDLVSRERVDRHNVYEYGTSRILYNENKFSGDHGITSWKSWDTVLSFYKERGIDSPTVTSTIRNLLNDKSYLRTSLLTFTERLDKYIDFKGVRRTHGKIGYSGNAEVGTPGISPVKANVSGHLSVGHETIDQRTANLNYAVVVANYIDAFEKAKQITGTTSGRQFEQTFGEILLSNFSKLDDVYEKWASSRNAWDYGATAYGKKIVDSMGWLGEKAKDIIEKYMENNVNEDELTKMLEKEVWNSGIRPPKGYPGVEK